MNFPKRISKPVKSALFRPNPRRYALACVASLSLPSLLMAQGNGGGSTGGGRGESLDTILGAAVHPLPIMRLTPASREESMMDASSGSSDRGSQQSAQFENASELPYQAIRASGDARRARYETPVIHEPELNGRRPDFLSGPRQAAPQAHYQQQYQSYQGQQPYQSSYSSYQEPPAQPASYPYGAPLQPMTPPPAYGGNHGGYGMTRPAEQPGTIVTQIEIPLPPSTAEPLTMSESTPGGYYHASYSSAQQMPSAILAQAPVVGPAGSGGAPVYPQESYLESPLPTQNIPRQIDDPSLTTADIPPPQEHVSPAIIYDDAQQGIPRAPEPEPGPNISQMLTNRQYPEVEALAVSNRDTQLASALGWARYRDGNNELAYTWFEQALQWDNNNNEAAYGMALTLFRMGRYEQAEQVARWRVDQYPRMQKVLADISSRKAVSSLRSRDHRGSERNLDSTRQRRPLTREEKIVAAWNAYNRGEREKARQEFLKLYKQKPDRFAAHGVYTVYAANRDWDGLERLVCELGGPLEQLYKNRIAEKYADLGLYRMAYRQDPQKFKHLAGINSPVVAVEMLGRTRSGTDGTSQLSEYGARLRATLYAKDQHRFDIAVGVTHLDAGTLQSDTKYGYYPPDGVVRPYRYQPKTNYPDLVDFRVRWEYQSFLTPMIELGITPANGELSPTVVGALGLKKTETWGNWTAEIYRTPVKDSVLSYTGLRDPYTGKKWGRVTETGGRFSIFNQFRSDWSFYGAASVGMLTGHNVPNNAHGAFSMAVSKSLKYDGLEYLTIGPTLAMDFYNKNLSQFTYGQGGYFSPDYLVQAAIAAQFMTEQGGTSLLRGSASVGFQMNRQEATPLFPNNPDGRWYSSLSSSGFALNLDLEGLTMLSENWALGGQVGVAIAPNYNDFSLRVSLQYFFESRNGLFAQDFFRF